tara:strand:- start:396 stop:605 length:210 start_codon:yes stop_codon:yes gene_type:complete
MPSDEYKHYLLLTPEDLISIIEKKDKEIGNLLTSLKETKESRDKYCAYNQFHMEEISRLDKQIGEYKKS